MINADRVDYRGRPFLMAGPCSAESRDQIVNMAEGLVERGCHLFRAGLWKPRTRPGSFEGVGEKGIDWMLEARNRTGIKLATEVANTQHAELILDAGFDAVWIGARTTANPFSVQEIAEVLRGSSMPVIIKNPINPDVGLWLGAIERMLAVGVKDLMLIHRGFSVFNSKPYRNDPSWQIPIEVRSIFPDLPMLCDISHIAGARPLLPEVAQAAFDLDYEGIMVEVHPDPPNALSDPKQQIDLDGLDRLLADLVIRKTTPSDKVPLALEEMRHAIDQVDGDLLELLGKRMDIARQIGEIKEVTNMPVLQPERWQAILDAARATAADQNLSEGLVEAIFRAIHQESIDQQMLVMRNASKVIAD